jgi:DNA topoisomerase-1
MLDAMRERTEQQLVDDLQALQPEEAAVLAMLQQRLAREAEAAAATQRKAA